MKLKLSKLLILLVLLVSSAFTFTSCQTQEQVSDKKIAIDSMYVSKAISGDFAHTLNASDVFIIAMPIEAKYIINEYKLKKLNDCTYFNDDGIVVIITGVGGKLVKDTLSKYYFRTSGVKFFNVGLCGSNVLDIGTVHEVSGTMKIESKDAPSKISDTGVVCYSADKFVTETTIKEPCVFDMELAYIKEIFPNVISHKIVSDKLKREEYENFEADKSWSEYFKIIDSKLSKGK